MPTIVDKHVGPDQAYTSQQAAIDSLPKDLVAADIQPNILLHKGEIVQNSTLINPVGFTTDPTHFFRFRPAPGHSYREDPNFLTTPLRYDPLRGAAMAMTGGYTNGMKCDAAYTRFEELQIYTTGDANALRAAGSNITVDRCLFEATPEANGAHAAVHLDGENSEIKNSLVVVRAGGRSGIFLGKNCKATNNYVVVPSDAGTGDRGITSGADGPNAAIVQNNSIFGFGTATNGVMSADGHNATDCAAFASAATGSLTSLVYADQFQNTATATRDFRPKLTSAFIDAGVATGDTKSINDTARASGAAYDIGAWEVPQAASALTLDGPTTGSAGAASTNFTVATNGSLAGPCEVTPSAGAGGGTFTPATIMLTDAQRSGTFTYTPASAGNKSISIANDSSLANPQPVAMTVSNPDLTAPQFVSARVAHAAPNVIVVTFSEALAPSVPPNSAFAASLGRTVTGVSINGPVVYVTVDTPYTRGDAITIAYTKPGANPRLQDPSGNLLESVAAQSALNGIKVAVPTPSSPGIVVVKVGSGAGQDYADLDALRVALPSLKLKTLNVRMIAECYQDGALGNYWWFGLPFDEQDDNHYLTIRPVPGFAESDLNPNAFNYGSDGLELVLDNVEVKSQRGVRFEGFRAVIKGNSRWNVGGPNPDGAPTPNSYVAGFDRMRFKFMGTAPHAISLGEHNVAATLRRNLFYRESGTSDVECVGGGHNVLSNTFAARTGAPGPMLSTGDSQIPVENNVFLGTGGVPFTGTTSNVAGNYTNQAVTSPRTGLTAVTGSALVVDASSNFLPATGSALLGNATASANSFLDIFGKNSGIDPDVGAAQKIGATPLPSGSVIGNPKPSGQQLRVPFTTTQKPTSAMATLTPAINNPGEAIGNNGVVTRDNVNDIGEAVYSDIAPGNYDMTITISNDGGTASISGVVPVSILPISGEPQAQLSGPITLSPPGKPTGVTVQAGSGQVLVAWTPPFNTGGSPIIGYELVASTGEQIGVENGPVIFALSNNVSRTISVRAINAQGPGPLSDPSQPVMPTVPRAKPGAPTIGLAVAKNRSVMLNFTPPASSGDSPITGYIVTSSTGDVHNVNGSPATFPAANNAAASYQVQAVSSIGAGPKSASSNSVTPQVTATIYLKNPDGTPLGGLVNIKWAWFDQPTPDLFTAPVNKGAAEQAEAVTGKVDLVLPDSALESGGVGCLAFTNSEGSVTVNHRSFFGPVKVNQWTSRSHLKARMASPFSRRGSPR